MFSRSMIKTIRIISIHLLILSANCIYVYKSSIENALLDHVGEKEDSCQPMVFCIGGASDKFTYIRAKPYRSSFLDSVNLFKFYEGNRRKDIHFWRHEHGDYGTPEGKLPIRIVDTSIVDIDSTIYGKHISNCPTIYFRLKKPGRTEMIIRMAMMRKDTISLLVNDQGLSVSKNRKVRKGKTKWLGIFPLKN